MAKADSLYKRHAENFNVLTSKTTFIKTNGEAIKSPSETQWATGHIVNAILFAACIIAEAITNSLEEVEDFEKKK